MELSVVFMPIGLCNSTATFQSKMNITFHDYFEECMVINMDYLLMFSLDNETNYKHLDIVLLRVK